MKGSYAHISTSADCRNVGMQAHCVKVNKVKPCMASWHPSLHWILVDMYTGTKCSLLFRNQPSSDRCTYCHMYQNKWTECTSGVYLGTRVHYMHLHVHECSNTHFQVNRVQACIRQAFTVLGQLGSAHIKHMGNIPG